MSEDDNFDPVKAKKPVFRFIMAGITNAEGSENFTVDFNGFDGESEEVLKERIAMAKRLFDSVWLENNKKAVLVNKVKKDELPEQFK